MMVKSDIIYIISNLKTHLTHFDAGTREVWTFTIDDLVDCITTDDWYAASKVVELMQLLLRCSAFDAWPHGPAFSTTAVSGLRVAHNFITASAQKSA